MTTQRTGAAETRPLDILGISEAEEHVYSWLLAHSGATVPEIAQALKLTPGKAQRLLDSIEAKGLTTHSPERPRRYIPTSPDITMEALILQRQNDLQRARGAVQALHEQAAATQHRGEREQMVELITSPVSERQLFEQMQLTAQREIIAMTRPPVLISRLDVPYEQDQKHQRMAQTKGVHYRSIVDQNFLSLPGAVARVRQDIASGEGIRVLPTLPNKIMISDRRIALIPLNLHQAGSPVLLVRSSALLDALCALFEVLWEQAAPISITTEGLIKTGAPSALLSREGEKLVSLLAAGLNDKRLAQEMDISTATLTRRVSEIMKAFHARTRFQLGWLAHKRLSGALSDKS
ncbi:MAG: helix-turn-helix domain-containing protein [Gammaproteobacteria bacterium]